MAARLIDVWDVETFDEDLLGKLRARAELVHNYIVTDRESEASGLRPVYPSNPYSESYHRFLEDLDRDMETRTIHARHCTSPAPAVKPRSTARYISTRVGS